MAISSRRSREGVAKSSHAPVVSKIDGAVRHRDFRAAAGLVLAPVLDRGHARLDLLLERGDHLLQAPARIERRRRHHVVHAVVEVLDRRASTDRARNRRTADPWRSPRWSGGAGRRSCRATIGPEALEARAAERGVLREQEVAAPEALARHRAVGLAVDGEENAGRVVRLRHALRRSPARGRRDRRRSCPDAASSCVSGTG